MKTYICPKVELLQLFAENGMTKYAVGQELDLSYATMINISKGKPVLPATAKKICDFFHVYMWDFFEMRTK